MDEARIVHFIFWVIIFTLVWISWIVENEKAARILLGLTIELVFIYASYYGGTMV